MMAKRKTLQYRMNKDTIELLKRISAERYLKKMDKIQLPPYKLVDATLRIPNVIKILERSNIKNDE